MTPISHRQKLQAQKIAVIVFLEGKSVEGDPIFYYLGVRIDKLQAFIKVQKTGKAFHPEEYGIIIAEGEGQPDDKLKQFMTDEYGFDHNSQVVSKPNGN